MNILVFVLLAAGIVILDLYLQKQRNVKFRARIKKQHDDIERLRALVSEVSHILAKRPSSRDNKGPNILSLSSSVKVEAQNIFINVYNPEVLSPEQLTALSGSSVLQSMRESRSSTRVLNYRGAEAFELADLAKGLLGRGKK